MKLRKWILPTYSMSALFLRAHAGEVSGFFTETAALYWKAEVNGLSYAIESPSALILAPHSSVKNPSFDWDFGFKAGLGYRTKHDGWEFFLGYTSLQTHADAHKHVNVDNVLLPLRANAESDSSGGVLYPIWLLPIDTALLFAEDVKMHWRLHLGIFDLLMRKMICPGRSFSLRPQLGLRTAWIRQKFNVAYSANSVFPDQESAMRTKNKFFGVGPNCGLYGQWNIKGGFALFSEAALSILFGEFYLHQDEDLTKTKKKVLGVHDIYRQSVTLLDGSAGLMWERDFEGTLKRVQVRLGWDQSLYFSQNQLIRFVSGNALGTIVANQGDLSLSGVELSARLDF